VGETEAAEGAESAVQADPSPLQGERPFRAEGEALPVADAPLRYHQGPGSKGGSLGRGGSLGYEGSLGVVAPETPQGTPLEEEGHPDSRAVVEGETLDVEDPAFRLRFDHTTGIPDIRQNGNRSS